MASSPLISAWTPPKAVREGDEYPLFKIWAAEALANPGASLTAGTAKAVTLDDRTVGILESRAWEMATMPVKSMGMNLFMLWLMGTGAGIFTILLVAYAVIQAVEMLFRVDAVFLQFKGADTLILQKTVYLSLNLMILIYLGNKAGHMGLLPLASGDWIGLLPITVLLEKVRT